LARPSAMKPNRIRIECLGRGGSTLKLLADLLTQAGYVVTTETRPDRARRPGEPVTVMTGRALPAGRRRAGARRGPGDPTMNLQELREHVHQTQGDVARRASVSQPQLSRVEGRRDHLVSTLRKYVRALGGDVQVIAALGAKRIILRDV